MTSTFTTDLNQVVYQISKLCLEQGSHQGLSELAFSLSSRLYYAISMSPPSWLGKLSEEGQRDSESDNTLRSIELASKLRVLEDYETIIICDDSGSMSAIVDDSTGPLGKKKTRWDELCQTVSIITEIATALDPNGIDIYFLNRSPLHNVRATPTYMFIILRIKNDLLVRLHLQNSVKLLSCIHHLDLRPLFERSSRFWKRKRLFLMRVKRF